MKTFVTTLLFVISTFVQSYDYEDGVIILNDDNVNQALDEFNFTLIYFHAPSCLHCRTLTPEYIKTADNLVKSRPEIKICKIDASSHKKFARKNSLKSLPTLMLFTRNESEPIIYGGERTAIELTRWLKKKTGPVSVELFNTEEVETLTNDSHIISIFFGAATSETYKNYLSVAQNFNDIEFAHSHNKTTYSHCSNSEECVVLYKKFDEGRNILDGGFNEGELITFLNENIFPAVKHFNNDIYKRVVGDKVPTIVLVEGNVKADEYVQKAFHEAALRMKNKFLFSSLKADEPVGTRIAQIVDFKNDDAPAMWILEHKGSTSKYFFEQAITTENIVAFVENFNAGNLRPYLRSDPIPVNSYEGSLRIVVGKNFEEIVLDSDNDVLVFFYDPKIDPCNSLMPIYSNLARRLNFVENLVIARMDVSSNEVGGIYLGYIPNTKLFLREFKSDPVDFASIEPESESSVYGFLKQYSSARLPIFDTDL